MKRILHLLFFICSLHICASQEKNTFGRTHFILNYPTSLLQGKKQEEVVSRANSKLVECSQGVCRAYFSPHDNIKQKLIDLINSEQKSIQVSIYMFNDKDIAQALIDAKKKRKIIVEVIADSVCLKDRFSKIPLLQQEGIPVTIYQAQNNGLFPEIMHNKFVVFKKNINNKQLVWTGSFNFTNAANTKNPENVVVLDNEIIVEQYSREFNRLKELIAHGADENKIVKNARKLKQTVTRTVKNVLKNPKLIV